MTLRRRILLVFWMLNGALIVAAALFAIR